MNAMSRKTKIWLLAASVAFAFVSIPFGCLIAANQTSVYSSHAAVLSPAYVTVKNRLSSTEIDQNMSIPPIQAVALHVEKEVER